MTKIKSVGKCVFCKKEYGKQGISRHLSTHLSSKIISDKPGLSYHLKIETSANWGPTPYFLHLWADGECTFEEIDAFLREIWLECCGHMSAFRIAKNASPRGEMFDVMDAYDYLDAGDVDKYNEIMKAANGQVPMGDKLKDHAEKGLKIEYEYDFGSSTVLDITIINKYPVEALESIVLLSRNEPLNYLCSICGVKKATETCSVCSWEEDANFCPKCAKIHDKKCEDFDDYAKMPLVNSPRTGVCAYEGGIIDTGRD